jgi:hypothetical protein
VREGDTDNLVKAISLGDKSQQKIPDPSRFRGSDAGPATQLCNKASTKTMSTRTRRIWRIVEKYLCILFRASIAAGYVLDDRAIEFESQ